MRILTNHRFRLIMIVQWAFIVSLLMDDSVLRVDAFRPVAKLGTSSLRAAHDSSTKHHVSSLTETPSTTTKTGLTIQQQDQLEEVLSEALNRMTFVMDQTELLARQPVVDGEESHELLPALFQDCLESVRVADSTIPQAGKGLFATRDLPKYSIVGFYPVHCIGCIFPSPNENAYNPNVCQSVQISEDPCKQIDHENSQYALLSSFCNRPLLGVDLQKHFHPETQLYVDMNPHNSIEPGWYCGYINDGAIVQELGDEEYYPKSLAKQNVEIVPFGSSAPFFVGVTTKDVRSGDELFFSYGYSYWAKKLTTDNRADLKKSATILEQEDRLTRDTVEAIEAVNELYKEAASDLVDLFHGLGPLKDINKEEEKAILLTYANESRRRAMSRSLKALLPSLRNWPPFLRKLLKAWPRSLRRTA